MKKLLLLFALITLSVISMASVERTGAIRTGYTMLSRAMSFTSADSVVTSDTLNITITNLQKYVQNQVFTITLDSTSGDPSISIIAYGKVASADDWTAIGSEVTWDDQSDNPGSISSTAAYNYNYLKVQFIASGTTQKSLVTSFSIKTTNVHGYGNINLAAGYDLIGSSTSDITMNTNKFTVAGATGNTAVGGTLGVTGVSTFTGGYTFTNASPVIWAKGGSTVLATSGTDVACANGNRFWVEIDIPYNVTLTGLAYLIGSIGATDSVVVQLVNSAGVEVATSKTTGATHGAIVGTAANFQSCPFAVGATPTPYAAVAGKYYAVVQFNGTTAKFRAYPIPGSKFITGTVAGTWDTKADITPGTTFTADKGPIVMTY